MKKDFMVKFGFYLFIGVYGAVIDLAVSNFCFNLPGISVELRNTFVTIFSQPVYAVLAVIFGSIAGLINNFLMNEYLVYDSAIERKEKFKRFYKYLIAVIIGGFIIGNFIVFNFCFMNLHLGFSTSKVIALAVGTLINYPINYFWTWGSFSIKKKNKQEIQ